MSHHLDTPLAAQNGQLFIDDLYVFPGDGSTVFVLDVNSNITGVYAQPGFHPEARYEFKVHFDYPANTRHPSQDVAAEAGHLAGHVAAVVAASGTAGDPEGYGQAVARDLLPDLLSYQVGTPATFGFAARNGRPMADNAPEVMLSLVTGTAILSGLRPSVAENQRSSTFPYVIAVR